MILTCFILYIHAKTIRIRISCQNQIGIVMFCKLQCKFKRLCCFRVRIAYRREVAIRQFLFRYDIHVLESKLTKDSSGRDISGSMERRIYNLQFFSIFVDALLVQHEFLQLCHICVVNLFSDDLIEAFMDGFLFRHGNGILYGDCLYLAHDTCIVWRCDLCAIFPIHLVSVILRWVVTGCHIDTCHTAKITDCKGKLRGRAQRLEPVRLDAICGQAKRCHICKLRRTMSGIIRNRNTLRLLLTHLDIVRKALGRLRNDIIVHAVCSCSDDATKSGCTELKIHVKALFDLFFIILDCSKLLSCCFIEKRICQPFFINLFVIHVHDVPPTI